MPQSMTEGPLGFTMTDGQAKLTEAFLARAAGPFQHIQIVGKSLEANSRTDISWISTESADRYNHVVRADGMDDLAYTDNPIVTNNHNYEIPPIGRSLWRKIARRAGTKGIQAMTHYPPRPAGLVGDWPPDMIFAQITAGLLNAKSIGLIPLEIVEPGNPDHPLIITKWALIEYAVGTIPVNPETTVISVTKTLDLPSPRGIISIEEQFAQIDAAQIVRNCLDRLRGTI